MAELWSDAVTGRPRSAVRQARSGAVLVDGGAGSARVHVPRL